MFVQMLFVYYFENSVICSMLVEWSRMLYANMKWCSRYIKWKKQGLHKMIPFVLTPENINIHLHTCVYVKHFWKEMRNYFRKGVNIWDEGFAFNYIYFCHVWLFFLFTYYSTGGDLHEGTKSHPNCVPN